MLSSISRKALRIPSALSKSHQKLQHQTPLTNSLLRTSKYHTTIPFLHPQTSKKPDGPEKLPAFNFKELGASRSVKFVLIAGLTVIGTMETIFYAKILMRKMGWDSAEDEGEK